MIFMKYMGIFAKVFQNTTKFTYENILAQANIDKNKKYILENTRKAVYNIENGQPIRSAMEWSHSGGTAYDIHGFPCTR